MNASTLLISLLIGMAFGAVLQRVQASSPDRVIAALRLRDLTIIKFMLLAIGVGAVGIGTLTMFGLAHLKIKTLSLLGVGLGGIVFGLGFGAAGYCPGTCLVGSVEGRKDARYTVLGGLTGALLFAFAYPFLKPVLIDPLNYGSMTLAELSGTSKGVAGIGFGVLLSVLALALPVRTHVVATKVATRSS